MNNTYSILKKEESEILKLREKGWSYKKLAKKFDVDVRSMEGFLKGIEISNLNALFDEIKRNR